MASFQARQRDPLLHQSTQAMLERRGRELLGLALVLAALVFALTLGSYSPEDPGWMVATDDPAQNMLGRFGAAVASTLTILIGLGAWSIPLILGVWGVRFMAHAGGERALGRVVFAVIAVAFAAVHCATLVPVDAWTHTFGLGGLFGDTVLGSLIGVMPGTAGFGLKLLSLLTFAGLVVMMLYVTGFDMAELRAIRRFLLLGTLHGYNALAAALGSGARGAVHGAMALQDRARSRAETASMSTGLPSGRRAMPPVTAGGPGMAPEPLRASPLRAAPAAMHPEPLREKPSFLARLRRQATPEPELIETDAGPLWDTAMPSEDRIRARISDVIRARVQRVPDPMSAAPALRAEPPVMRTRGPAPLMADTRPLPRVVAPAAPVPQVWADEAEDDPTANIFAEDAAWDDAADDLDDDALDDLPAARPMGLAADRRGVVQHAAKKSAPSRQALAETQPGLRFDDAAPAYELPPLGLLSSPVVIQRSQLSNEALEENARMLESVLDDYGVKGEIVAVRPGPVVTMYELEPAPGLKASRVIGLADDIARSMSALSARVSTVPGRTVIGIELPNAVRDKVVLREILSARDFGDSQMRLPLALGKDIGGDPIVANSPNWPPTASVFWPIHAPSNRCWPPSNAHGAMAIHAVPGR